MQLRARLVLSLAAAAFAGGCSRAHGHHHPPFDPYTYEIEPNDFYWTAQGIGPIDVGESVWLRGHVSDFTSDRYDGYAFQSWRPMDIEFHLTADDPHADFDIALFDPYTLTTVAVWESGSNHESGFFSVATAGTEFHLVVSSYTGTDSYTLEVRGTPLTFGLATGGARRADGIDWERYRGANAARPNAIGVEFTQVEPDGTRTTHLVRAQPVEGDV